MNNKPYIRRSSNKNCRVYVSNLSFDVSWQNLKDYMKQAGKVIYADIIKQKLYRSKGCGVVEYSTPEEAKRAIETLNNTMFMGRPIFNHMNYRNRMNNMNNNVNVAGRQIFVGNIPYSKTWQDIKDLFKAAGGNIIRVNLFEGMNGRSKGQGTILFETVQDAKNAIAKFNQYEWGGRKLEVREVNITFSFFF
ncbi:hypothetical protein U3516DRAFT_574650 [Neocallimastix sp. 'constans']